MSKRYPFLLALLLAVLIASGAPASAEMPAEAAEAGEVPADAPGETADASPANLDDDREAVRSAQQSLANLGYYDDRADGRFGKHTEAAVRAFQRQCGLSETGHLDEQTAALLEKYASENVNARSIQQRLIDLGYLQGAADGKLGGKSKTALRIFQRVNALRATGAADAETIIALFSDDVAALPEGLSAGSKGDDVAALQRSLRRFGFTTEDADGEYGKGTSKAVQAFQQHLAEQGIPVEATPSAAPLARYCLGSEAYSSYLRDVSVGTTDGEARRVELRLSDLGYLDAAADDTFDDYAREALCLFQRKAGLEAAGVADRKTVDALFSASAPEADHCAPHEIASGDTGLAVRDVQTALYALGYTVQMPDGKYGAGLEKTLGLIADYLKEEDSPAHLTRETVESIQNGFLEYCPFDPAAALDAGRLQNRLYTLFYLEKSGIDGMIGDDTLSALREFQRVNGLAETNAPDQATIAALFSKDAVAKQYRFRVEVSIDRQAVDVWALNDQKEYALVRSFTCSTGLHDSTPRGIYLKAHPVNRWHYFKKFGCWAQYSFKIVDDIMFHSVIYGSKSESSLRRSSQRNLGNPASHGCVRLTVEDAKWLYEHCPRGSAVVVIY